MLAQHRRSQHPIQAVWKRNRASHEEEDNRVYARIPKKKRKHPAGERASTAGVRKWVKGNVIALCIKSIQYYPTNQKNKKK